MLIYAVKDVKAGFLNPFCRSNDELAIRDFKDCLSNQDKNNIIASHPEDFELWRIGYYNTDNGIITSDIHYLFSAIGGVSDE